MKHRALILNVYGKKSQILLFALIEFETKLLNAVSRTPESFELRIKMIPE